jgi:hypothetical protein
MGAIDADASGSISWAEFLSAIFLSQEGEHWNTRHDVGLEKAWKMEIKNRLFIAINTIISHKSIGNVHGLSRILMGILMDYHGFSGSCCDLHM